ncbi:MAG: hypothetical protein QGG90_06765, partial [Nitrospinota bacterium]|nr:hypothetical protein [Nitrospinota bacterium]
MEPTTANGIKTRKSQLTVKPARDSPSPKQTAQARAGPGENAQAKAAVQATPEPTLLQNLETRS